MTFEEYTSLLEKVEKTHSLYWRWDDFKERLGEILVDITLDATRHGGDFNTLNELINEAYKFTEYHTEKARYNMKSADEAIGTDEAREARRLHEIELWMYLRDKKDKEDAEEISEENQDGSGFDDGEPFEPYDVDTSFGLSPCDDYDYVAMGMGV